MDYMQEYHKKTLPQQKIKTKTLTLGGLSLTRTGHLKTEQKSFGALLETFHYFNNETSYQCYGVAACYEMVLYDCMLRKKPSQLKDMRIS